MIGINLSQILESIGLQDVHVTHAYLVGSRLWGTHTHSSDYDLLLIVNGLSTEMLGKSQHKGQYDVTLLTLDEFSMRLASGSLVETLCCLFDKDELLVLRGEQSMKDLIPDIPVAEAWVTSRHDIDRAKAKKFWQKGKLQDAFKILQHAIMAESVVRGLKAKLNDSEERLNSISLTSAELQIFVQSGRDEDDWTWLALGWEEVQRLHSVRLQKVKQELL